MTTSIERVFAPKKAPKTGVAGWSNGRAVAILSTPRGEKAKSFPVWFSADGQRFIEGKLDTSKTKVEYLDTFNGPTLSPTGRLLQRRDHHVFEAALGENVTFVPLFTGFPDQQTFTVSTLIAHPDGSLWLGGYKAADSAVGWLYRSHDEGQSWKKVHEKLPGAVHWLSPHGEGVLALAYRSVLHVTAKGSNELAKYKDVVIHAHVDERGVFGFGETFTAFGAPGKKAKYGKLLGEGDRNRRSPVAFAAGRFALSKGRELFTSPDALDWHKVEGFDSGTLRALLPSATGILAVSNTAEVFALG